LNRTLWFVAILPPADIAEKVRSVQQEIAERFGPRRALRLPPHITVEPPFRLDDAEEPTLRRVLGEFLGQQRSFDLALRNFGSFRDDVIFLEIAPNLALLELQGALSKFMRGDAAIIQEPPFHEGYTPHMTVANRDVTPPIHHRIWDEFNTRKFYAEFRVERLTLMRHDGTQWHRHADFSLGD